MNIALRDIDAHGVDDDEACVDHYEVPLTDSVAPHKVQYGACIQEVYVRGIDA